MKIEVLALATLAVACSPKSEWPSERGLRCVQGETVLNGVMLADEMERLSANVDLRHLGPLDVADEYKRRSEAAGCTEEDRDSAQNELGRRDRIRAESERDI